LAAEGSHLDLTWSEKDSVPRLTRYTPDDIVAAFRNSTFARSRGHTYANLDSFGAACNTGGGATQ
jgi:hypothetical protein